MKNNIKCLVAALVFTAAACDPDLVDELPYAPTESTYFTNVNEFRSTMAGAYGALYSYYHFNAPEFNWNGWPTGTWLLPGDDLTESQAARTAVELFDGSLNSNNRQLEAIFFGTYKMIGRTSVILDKINTVDFSDWEGADEIRYMEGESLFLRAYGYYILFNIFGEVPIITQRIQTQEETNTPKSPALEVLNQVITDATAAIEILPEEWEQIYVGRANKDAARGLLAKALVMRANYAGDNADYGTAITVFNSIGANLVPNYIDNFNAFTENNDESLFEVQAAAPTTGNNNLSLHNDGAWRGVENMSVFRGYMMEPSDEGSFNTSTVTRFLVTDKLLNQFGTDPRITVFLSEDDGFNGRIFQKYNLPEGVNVITPLQGGSANNERVLRYADLMLVIAEAHLKTGSPGEAIALVNEIRTRAREWGADSGLSDGTAPANHPSAETDASTIMQWIMDERFVELAGEGQRYWDLKRWHAAGDIDLTGWGGGDEHFSTYLASPVQFDVNKHLVFPLPQAEIDRNSAITGNNPNY